MSAPKKYPTQPRLKNLLHYDPETGAFTWRISRGGTARAGSGAGSDNGRGYELITVDGVRLLTHRLAFVYMTGAPPPGFVDHINRDRSDNRWANLRPATRRENAGNVGRQRNNTSGHRGVVWSKQRGKWQACGFSGGRRTHLGLFSNLEEAAAVAQKWREETFGVFAM